MATTANKPVQTFRLKGVKVSVFENRVQDATRGQEGVFHKLTVQKIYREGEEWKTTNSLGRDDVPVARLLLAKAWEFVLERESPKQGERSEA